MRTFCSVSLLLLLCLTPELVMANLSATPDEACQALGQAVAFAQAVAGAEPAPEDLIPTTGVFVWQQPGVALVVGPVLTEAAQTRELNFARERCAQVLRHCHELSLEEPFLHPAEPENNDQFEVQPQVYLLNADAAQRRLNQYTDGYHYWLDLNPGLEPATLTEVDLTVVFAVVFIDSSGPVEFYFVERAGELTLTHFIYWEFFSA